MNDDMILVAMRRMAYQRAKGELISILDTYPDTTYPASSKISTAKNTIDQFINDFEDYCLK